jgi:protein-tyrosine phosphatase
MFTDIHTHILPEIDDGCKKFDESLLLLDSAIKNKVENIILTPHYDPGNLSFPAKKEIVRAIELLKEKAEDAGIKINIYPGAEVKVSQNITDILKTKKYLLTLCDNNKYILIEAPFFLLPANLDELIFEMKLMGLNPILAHPERNEQVRKNIKILNKIKEMGLLLQINNTSLINRNSHSYKTAVALLKNDMVDFIASDCHFMKGRHSNFLDAYRILSKLVGTRKADLITMENPQKVISNMDFEI